MKKNMTRHRKDLYGKIAHVLGLYMKTQLILVFAVTVVTWGFLALLNVRYPLVLSLVTGSLSVIPVLGLSSAAIIVATVAIFDGVRFLPDLPVVLEGLAVLIIFALLNIGTDYFLSPYLTGKVTNISGVLLLFCVLIGTIVFGVWGAVFSVPVVLVGKTIYDHYTT